MCLNSIFNENVVTHGTERNVVVNSQVSGSVNSNSSVETLMDSVLSDVRVMNSTNHVHVERISSKLEGLTYVCEFDTF
jgi:hypothetical protein